MSTLVKTDRKLNSVLRERNGMPSKYLVGLVWDGDYIKEGYPEGMVE